MHCVGADRARWTEAHHAAGLHLSVALSEGLLQGAAVTVLPAFKHALREKLLNEWLSALDAAGIAHGPAGALLDGLAPPAAQRRWAARGLSMDACSVMNAALTLAPRRQVPLLLDPQVRGRDPHQRLGFCVCAHARCGHRGWRACGCGACSAAT